MKNFVSYILLISTVLILIFSSNNVKREKIIRSYDQKLKGIENKTILKGGVDKVYILGHRGYPEKHTENTLESFKVAIESGADGIELDVWKTKDGEIIVSHDGNLQRVFGVDLNIKESSLEEIKNKAPVPTLKEVFEAIPRGKIINIEIKDVNAGNDVIKLVKEYNLSKFVIFSSFDHELIRQLSQKYLDEKFGYLFNKSHVYLTLEDIKKMFEPENIFSANLPVQLIEYDNELFNKLTQLLRYMDKKIVLWTVNDEKIITGIHVDYIITDDVEKMVMVFKKK